MNVKNAHNAGQSSKQTVPSCWQPDTFGANHLAEGLVDPTKIQFKRLVQLLRYIRRSVNANYQRQRLPRGYRNMSAHLPHTFTVRIKMMAHIGFSLISLQTDVSSCFMELVGLCSTQYWTLRYNAYLQGHFFPQFVDIRCIQKLRRTSAQARYTLRAIRLWPCIKRKNHSWKLRFERSILILILVIAVELQQHHSGHSPCFRYSIYGLDSTETSYCRVEWPRACARAKAPANKTIVHYFPCFHFVKNRAHYGELVHYSSM